MKTMNLILSLCLALVAASPALADRNPAPQCYYLDSENGNDAADGLSPENAWKSLKRINGITLHKGEKLLFKRGSVFNGSVALSCLGAPGDSVLIDAYGEGAKPVLSGIDDGTRYTMLIRNSEYVTIQNLELVNKGAERLPGRCGLELLSEDYGVCHGVHVRSLYIHDVNGTLKKHLGEEGCGILVQKNGFRRPSCFDGLIIENCVIRRCERNGINWVGGSDRSRWFPDTNTLVRYNLLEEVPGDGIVPIGCDGVIIEYNLMRNCTDLLPVADAAAGFWPWSCDNVVIQFNEVSDHHAPVDAQAYDSDYNSNNTVIRYNYSHDNDGGFLLVCTPTPTAHNIGNFNTRVYNNVSIGDGKRNRQDRGEWFSPIIEVIGPSVNTVIEKNILCLKVKSMKEIDSRMLVADKWGTYSDGLVFRGNVMNAEQTSWIDLTESTNNHIESNYYLGKMKKFAGDAGSKTKLKGLKSKALEPYVKTNILRSVSIADGAATMLTVDKEAIEDFFENR